MLISRRNALGMLGSAGAASLIGCGGGGTSSAELAATGTSSCVVTPAETIGPYFVDEKLNRSDLTTGTTDSNVMNGVPLSLNIGVYTVNGSACTALQGATIDLWHADAGGVYSDEAGMNTSGQTFLRGYQVTDANGAAQFKTIYPGWYSGRTTHIHFMVRTFAASGATTYTFTSQLFFDPAPTSAVYAKAPYNARGAQDTTNATDSIYSSALLLTLQPSGSGYAGTFIVGLKIG